VSDNNSKQDIYDLIEAVMEYHNSKNDSDNGKTYSDEPILRPASQLPRPIKQKSPIPEKIKEMKQLAYTDELMWQPRSRIFYEQARFMENYEDDCEFTGSLDMYYPVYTSMNVEQLRGYFTWRTNIRKGKQVCAVKPYIFMYIYEILNGIGVIDASDGYEKLKDIRTRFSDMPAIAHYLKRWIHDYIIYNDMSKELYRSEVNSYSADMIVLLNYREKDDAELFEAIKNLSEYDISASTFYKAYSEDYKCVVCGVYRNYSSYYEKNENRTLLDKYFRFGSQGLYDMFPSAVFYDRKSDMNREYSADEFRKFKCHNGKWYFSDLYCHTKSRYLGALMRSIDYIMRQKSGFRHKLRECTATTFETKLIEDEIGLYNERKKRSEAAGIEIDVTKLGAIRKSADITRDKLIVDKEEYEAEESAPAEEIAEEPDKELPLDPLEYDFIRCLLYCGDIESFAKSVGTMPSILADSVNEKLFDLFGDTVIDLSGGELKIIEDYEDELKGMIY